MARSKLPILTGNFILPYLFQKLSILTTVELDTLLNERLAITFITTKYFLITVKAVQSSVILGEVLTSVDRTSRHKSNPYVFISFNNDTMMKH